MVAVECVLVTCVSKDSFSFSPARADLDDTDMVSDLIEGSLFN